ncbi:hypothetical protein [Colwellia sp. MB02u-14]|nr:hypothetical protein [Colwellia sp. MB02u-14]
MSNILRNIKAGCINKTINIFGTLSKNKRSTDLAQVINYII